MLFFYYLLLFFRKVVVPIRQKVPGDVDSSTEVQSDLNVQGLSLKVAINMHPRV